MIEAYIIEFGEVLDKLGIEYDDEAKLNDGGCIFQITNLDEEQKLLLSNIGLVPLGYNIYYVDYNEVNLNEKLQHFKPYFISIEKDQWFEIINKIINVDHECTCIGYGSYFTPSVNHILIATSWYGKLTTKNTEFSQFVIDLHNFIIEGFKKHEFEGYKTSHSFWDILVALRHNYSHDTTSWRSKDKIKIAKSINTFYKEYVGINTPSVSLDFINCQYKLLELGNGFLDEILKDLKHEFDR
ncbi:MAG: hypothetical protein ACOCP4_03040 [Candidatus Woesearchaeota archaeon]